MGILRAYVLRGSCSSHSTRIPSWGRRIDQVTTLAICLQDIEAQASPTCTMTGRQPFITANFMRPPQPHPAAAKLQDTDTYRL